MASATSSILSKPFVRGSWLQLDIAASLSATAPGTAGVNGSVANPLDWPPRRCGRAQESRKEGSPRHLLGLLGPSKAARSCCLLRERICRSPTTLFRFAQWGNAPNQQIGARMPLCAELHERAISNRSRRALVALFSGRE